MPIQHLVLSGGGPTAIKYLGTLKQLEMDGIWNSLNLKSIYGTSAGGILGVMLCCKHDWITLTDYIIKRPWENAFKISPDEVFNMYSKKGIVDIRFFEIFFKPLFAAKNISINITMKEFYELSGIDLHLFTLELNEFKMHDLSYKTHPDMQVLTAVYMTSSIPVLFSPVCIDGHCYIDGGLVNNYPLNYCIKDHPEVDDILAFKNIYTNLYSTIGNDSNVVDVVVSICQHLIKQVNASSNLEGVPHQINQASDGLSIEYFQQTLESEVFRQGLFNEGVQTAKLFIRTLAKTEEGKLPLVSHQNL